ncbi:MAG: Maf family protein [candidate division KSB1 bacterium]|nr:Maf family protein [candidate division KSB1 bacterium]
MSLLDLRGKRLILASQSPRRAQLLRLLGLEFEVRNSGLVEENHGPADPVEHVLALSRRKAEAVAAGVGEGYVVAADTIVVLDGEILGKPRDEAEAYAMLRRLSGRSHRVYTGFTVIEKPSGRSLSDFEVTDVHFRPLDDEEIWAYIRTGGPMDKAGAYGIQDLSAIFADRIVGCFYNVVGFPLAKWYQRMRDFVAGS